MRLVIYFTIHKHIICFIIFYFFLMIWGCYYVKSGVCVYFNLTIQVRCIELADWGLCGYEKRLMKDPLVLELTTKPIQFKDLILLTLEFWRWPNHKRHSIFYLCCCKVIHARAKRILDWRLKRRINQDRSKDVREMKNQAWNED